MDVTLSILHQRRIAVLKALAAILRQKLEVTKVRPSVPTVLAEGDPQRYSGISGGIEHQCDSPAMQNDGLLIRGGEETDKDGWAGSRMQAPRVLPLSQSRYLGVL